MRKVRRRSIVLTAFLFVSTVWAIPVPALGEIGGCTAPGELVFPARLNDHQDAQTLLSRMEEFSSASETYMQCLSHYATTNESRLTARDKKELRREYDKHVERFRKVSEKWNAVFGKYQEKADVKFR